MEKDIDAVVEMFKASAERENREGQRQIALCHMEGIGVARDFDEAIRLLCLTADSGDSAALLELGHVRKKRGIWKDMEGASRLVRRVAYQGNAFGNLQ